MQLVSRTKCEKTPSSCTGKKRSVQVSLFFNCFKVSAFRERKFSTKVVTTTKRREKRTKKHFPYISNSRALSSASFEDRTHYPRTMGGIIRRKRLPSQRNPARKLRKMLKKARIVIDIDTPFR